MEFLYEYGLFLLKTITFVIAIGVIAGIVVNSSVRRKLKSPGHIDVDKINERFDTMRYAIKQVVDGEDVVKKERKEEEKAKEKLKKQKKKQKKSDDEKEKGSKKRIFVVDFVGDIKASAVSELREIVSAILFNATTNDEVVVRLESSGGMVHSYGLAASQLDRLRQKGIPLTVCVDKVAASGGYMMACVANKLLAAPFSIIGSIGVVAQLPNFHKILKKNDIDFEQLTAGEHKRTLTLFGENTDKARKKFIEDLELTHQLFKDFVQQQRTKVDINKVATGEIWLGVKAKENNLVDELTTSDDYLTELAKDYELFEVTYVIKKSLTDKLGVSIQKGVEQCVIRLLEQLQLSRYLH